MILELGRYGVQREGPTRFFVSDFFRNGLFEFNFEFKEIFAIDSPLLFFYSGELILPVLFNTESCVCLHRLLWGGYKCLNYVCAETLGFCLMRKVETPRIVDSRKSFFIILKDFPCVKRDIEAKNNHACRALLSRKIVKQ